MEWRELFLVCLVGFPVCLVGFLVAGWGASYTSGTCCVGSSTQGSKFIEIPTWERNRP